MQQAKHHRCDIIAPVLRRRALSLSTSIPGGQSSGVCHAVTGFLKASHTMQCRTVELECAALRVRRLSVVTGGWAVSATCLLKACIQGLGPACRCAESRCCLRVDLAEARQGSLPVRGCDGDVAYLPLKGHLCFAVPVHGRTCYLRHGTPPLRHPLQAFLFGGRLGARYRLKNTQALQW